MQCHGSSEHRDRLCLSLWGFTFSDYGLGGMGAYPSNMFVFLPALSPPCVSVITLIKQVIRASVLPWLEGWPNKIRVQVQSKFIREYCPLLIFQAFPVQGQCRVNAFKCSASKCVLHPSCCGLRWNYNLLGNCGDSGVGLWSITLHEDNEVARASVPLSDALMVSQ